MIFIRPKVVVVYDTTTTKYADDDRAMFWTFGRDLAQVSDPVSGLHRFHSTRNSGATFKGALTTVLPSNSTVAIVDHGLMSVGGTPKVTTFGPPLHFLYRVEQRPSALDHTSDTWLNVFDAASSAGAVEGVSTLTGTNVDVAQLSGSGVVGFVKGATPTLPMSYGFTGTPQHTIAGLAPLTSYHVTMSAGPTATIAAAIGSGDMISSAAGVLTYDSTGLPAPMLPTITTTTLPNAVANRAYSQTLTASGDTPITWSIVAGTLPMGLTLNTATGVIAGTPTALEMVPFTVRASNSTGTNDKSLAIKVGALPSTLMRVTLGGKVLVQ
jgi:hypothetical protein